MQNDYFDSDEFKEILDVYEDSLTRGSVPYLDVDDYADVADYYMNADMPEQAIGCVDRGLSIYPDEQQLLLIKSGAYIYLHRFAEAEEIVRSYDEGNNEVLYQKAQLEYALYGNTNKAEEMFADWIRGEREYAQTEEEDELQREEYIRDSYIHVITSFIELTADGEYEEELVKRWIESYVVMFAPLGNYDSDLILADTVRSECLYDMVVKVYSSLLENNPYLKHGWTVLAAAQFTCNFIDDALESVEFALAIDPDDIDSILTKAHCLLSKECYAEAAELLEKYIRQSKDGSQQLALATCYVEKGDRVNALRSLQKAELYYNRYVSDKEYYASACYEIADLYFGLNKIDLARKYVDKALQIAPQEVEYQLLSATLMLAEGQVVDALPVFVSYIESQENVVEAVIKIVARLLVFSLDYVALDLLDVVERMQESYAGAEKIFPYKALIYIRQKDYPKASRYVKLSTERCRNLAEWLLAEYIPEGMSLERYSEWLGQR